MILDDSKFKPIRTFGIILTVAGIFGVFALIAELREPIFSKGGVIFLVVTSTLHLIAGFGILLRKKWGFLLMKLYLYMMYPCFPLGTLISIKFMGYIKENEIALFFIRKRPITF